MSSPEEPFLIIVNLSKIFRYEKDTKFTMLIDHTKMTIVYEVKEWIKWMFSLSSCINLTFGGTIIHDLEDVKILSKLKELEVSICGVRCYHQNLHKNILDKLEFYVDWNQTMVPKFFVEKLTLMKQKLNKKNQLNEVTELLPGNTSVSVSVNPEKYIPDDQRINFQNYNDVSNTSIAMEGKKNIIEEQASEFRAFENSNQINFDTEPQLIPIKSTNKQTIFTNTNIVNYIGEENSNFNQNSSEQKYVNSENFLSKTNSCETKSPKVNEDSNKKIEDKNKEIKGYNGRKKRLIKPFSLAEVVASLQKTQNQLIQPSKNSYEVDPEGKNKGSLNHAENYDFKKESETLKKKRKRVRKSKIKKKNLQLEEDQTKSFFSCSNNIFDTVGVKMSSHIRFHRSSEDEENSSEINKNATSEPKSEFMIMSENTNSDLFQSNGDRSNIFQTTTENKLHTPNPGNFNKNLDKLKDSSPAIGSIEIQKEENVIFLDEQMINGDKNIDSNGYSRIMDSTSGEGLDSEFNFLKSKYPFPVVFERFS